LATKIRAAYAKEEKAGGMVVDWKAKQLKAGIEMGEYLIEAKSLLPVRGFVKWCRDNFPDPAQRTLNRYMKLAREKDETHVSGAKGLRDAYKKSSAPAESDGQSDGHKELAKIQRLLSKAKDALNGYTDLAPCEEADTICGVVDALADWVAKYRGEAGGLNRLKDVNCEVPLNGAEQPTTPEENAAYATTE
jgi:hypothetical protein